MPRDPLARERFADLVRCHEHTLMAVALRLCRDRAEAEDMVQDTFERALRRFDRIDGSRHARAWLVRVLTNRFVDEWRRRRQMPVSEAVADREAPAPPDEPPATWSRVTADELVRAVARLDEPFRAAYQMFAIHEKSYEEIGLALGINKATVGTRLLRARRRLREILSELHGDRSDEEARDE